MATQLAAVNDTSSPMVVIDSMAAPVVITSGQVAQLGQNLTALFTQYSNDRRSAELKWVKNLRQYLGIYDPEIEAQLGPDRSRAYPRLTRVKCISVLSRIMNLMFPGNEDNWEVTASPNPEMSPADVMAAIEAHAAEVEKDGGQVQIDDAFVSVAVQKLADKRADTLSQLIKDQFQELGGDQTFDYIALNRKVAQSGILYGLGVLRGPFVRTQRSTKWVMDPVSGEPVAQEETAYKPQYDFLPVWDFYPDMGAQTFGGMDGWFMRLVLSRRQLRELADRPDFFGNLVKEYISRDPVGNYRVREFENDLRSMGMKANVNERKGEQNKYEVIVWNGPVSAGMLQQAGVDIGDMERSDDVEAEVWMVGGQVIKADMNPWRKIGVKNMRTVHTFAFDEDDTGLIGNGLPNVVRDSQMSIASATRMALDNAGVICGPQLEINTTLLSPNQDVDGIYAYKRWYRDDDDPGTVQWPAVREINIDGHLPELQSLIRMFMEFADAETFVGPATGGDVSKTPSEPMRTAAGASMLRGDAALPFKDIVRNFDSFTQSLVQSIIVFNRKFNPARAPEGDYNVIARGATSLIAKEVRGMQADTLAQTLTEGEMDHIDDRKLLQTRLDTRDMGKLLLPQDVVDRKIAARSQAQQEQMDQQNELVAAQIRETLATAFAKITQGTKNAANADATTANTVIDLLMKALETNETGTKDKAGASK